MEGGRRYFGWVAMVVGDNTGNGDFLFIIHNLQLLCSIKDSRLCRLGKK